MESSSSTRESYEEEAIRQRNSTMPKSDMTAQEWKEKGYEEFIKGNWSEALSHYTNALKLLKEVHAEKAVYYKYRAAAYLKLRDYEKVVEDCDSSLKIYCNDPEALFHRCQALEALEKFEEAYQDAENIILSDPNNEVIRPVATRLLEIVQERLQKNVPQMMDLAFNMSADKEKRETAMNNLLVLAREKAGAEEIFKKEGVSKIAQLVKVEKNEEVICSAIRIVGELFKNNISRFVSIMKYIDLPWCLEMMNSTSTERVNASQYCLLNILNTYSGVNNEPDSKPNEDLCKAHKKEIDTILSFLLNSVTSRAITGLARDAIIELIMSNIHCVTALDWTKRLVELRGLQGLMEVASEMEEYKYDSSINTTSSTQTIIGVCLAKIYENLYYAEDKNTFINAIDKFTEVKLLLLDTESKVRVVVAITTLLLGSLDIANAVIFKENVIEMISDMAKTDDLLQQKVVCECIVAAVTKYKEANVFIRRGVNILENLYQSKDDSVRVRAFVGLCKLSTFKDTLCSPTIRLFPHGATKELAKVCRQFLINPKEEKSMRKWAIKGLSYLTFNVDVKEELIKDQEAIQAMIEITKITDQSVLYGVLITFVNLCNAYIEQEHIPEMIELIEFSDQHFTEENKHELDDDDFHKRLCALAKSGVTRALVNLAKTDNKNSRELIARVFNSICIPEEIREIVVQQGGTKALLSLALDNTDKGKNEASVALVHLGLTIHPEIAFPGQIIMDVVRPIINLLTPECSISENIMILTALCHLAKVNNSMREHIFKEGIFQKIEAFVYEEDYKLPFVILINILVLSREVAVQWFEQNNSRVKYLVLLCKDEDLAISGFASATLVMLTCANKEACKKVFDSDSWLESLHFLLTNPERNIQRNGIMIVINMIRSTTDVAAKLIKTDIMELLRSLSNNTVQNKKIKELASIALEDAEERSSREERREALITLIRWECDKARRRGQLDLANRLRHKLSVYEDTEHVPTNIYLEFARITESRYVNDMCREE